MGAGEAEHEMGVHHGVLQLRALPFDSFRTGWPLIVQGCDKGIHGFRPSSVSKRKSGTPLRFFNRSARG